MTPLQSLIESGTKIWLDSVDPELVKDSYAKGITGATSNPIIISDLIKSGRFDDTLGQFLNDGLSDEEIAWAMTDRFVSDAQKVFLPVWEKTGGNDGYVSFELDPLLEDPDSAPAHGERVKRYIELAKKWGTGQNNRMIKVPATSAGIDALEEIASHGITINVTLIFTERQAKMAREAIWRGARKRNKGLDNFKSVYSIFVSRVDVYTEQQETDLSDALQGMVGIINAKRIWKNNNTFWADKGLRLEQEMIFASTGTKKPEDPKDKYIVALAGSDIMTNPPSTNEAVEEGGKSYSRKVDEMPSDEIIHEFDERVDIEQLEKILMKEGVHKFADPQKKLLELIASKRKELATA